jgi:hypothetical protein
MLSLDKMTTGFAVGECFSSYEELQQKADFYQKEKFVQLTHRNSKTLEAARKRVPKRVEIAKQALRHYSVHLACVFGDKKYKSRGSGHRPIQRFVYEALVSGYRRITLSPMMLYPNCSTVKIGCSAGIKLQMSDDCQSLTVTEVLEEHNHVLDKVRYYI